MAALFFPRLGSLVGTAGETLTRVPFLLSHDLVYLDEPNSYLRARATGRWHPRARRPSDYFRARPLAENSIRAYASDLQNFFSFLEAADRDWISANGADLVDDYDDAVAKGEWSASPRPQRDKPLVAGTPLSAATINRRTSTATEFLSWAADRGQGLLALGFGLGRFGGDFFGDQLDVVDELSAERFTGVATASSSALRMKSRQTCVGRSICQE
jgi:hypothetical protein